MPKLSESAGVSPLERRQILQQGLLGFGSLGLSLSGLFRLRAQAAQKPLRRSSLIVVWLHGGASHIETYDPKPDAPDEYRGPFSPIATRVPGMDFCELLPKQAGIADKFSILRSMVHTGFCHDDGPQQIFTGHPIQGRRLKPDNPDLLSIVNSLRADTSREIPNSIGITPIPYLGSAYLGPSHEPFPVYADPNAADFVVPNMGRIESQEAQRIVQRRGLRAQFDRLRRDIDSGKTMEAMDQFETQAWNMLSGAAARDAFDLSQESPATRDRYGRNTWGQRCLLARRLIEAGVELVSVTLAGPLCGRVQNWDDHAVNHHVFDGMKYRTVFFDQAVTALIEEIHERGLNEQTLVVVGGDFGRTPKISYAASTGEGVASGPAGTMQPGRDHWPHAMSFLFSGGGIVPGQVIGATDRRGGQVIERRVGVQDFLATIYRHLGIDAARIELQNFSGRPVPILSEGKPILELLPRGMS